jgi:hypothetical protein
MTARADQRHKDAEIAVMKPFLESRINDLEISEWH